MPPLRFTSHAAINTIANKKIKPLAKLNGLLVTAALPATGFGFAVERVTEGLVVLELVALELAVGETGVAAKAAVVDGSAAA
jgi:hypothetical protein